MDSPTLAAGTSIGAAPRFLAARPWIGDVAWAVLLALLGVFSRPTVSFDTPPQIVYTLIVIGCCTAVAVRRRFPRGSLILIGLLLLVHLLVVPEPGVFALAMRLVAVYTAQTQTPSPERWIFTILAGVGAVCGTVAAAAVLDGDWRARTIVVIAVTALLAVVALIGIIRRQARNRYQAAVERATVLEARQNAERRLATVEERARIAREMHDILGHSMNVIAMQAEGARYVLRSDPDQADTTLGDIARLSREAVDDVRDLIDVLRADDEPSTTRPIPSLADVAELIGSYRSANDRIRLHVSGDLTAVPAHVALSGYRIAQEALTNASKHAPDAAVIVRIAVSDRIVELTVANPLPLHSAPASHGGGHGLAGMSERAKALGGTVEAGPDPTTGIWKVVARLPRRRT